MQQARIVCGTFQMGLFRFEQHKASQRHTVMLSVTSVKTPAGTNRQTLVKGQLYVTEAKLARAPQDETDNLQLPLQKN